MPISIDDILQAAEDHGASDIFLQEGEIPRMKIHEQLMLFGDEKLLLPQMAGLWQACGADTLKDLDMDTGITSRTGVRFRVNLHKVLGRLSVQIGQYEQSRQELTYLSHHDPLTQLPNRVLGRSRMEQAIANAQRNGGRIALLFVDLDNFSPEDLPAVAKQIRETVEQWTGIKVVC